jgi:para-nitrobenzyl esterase
MNFAILTHPGKYRRGAAGTVVAAAVLLLGTASAVHAAPTAPSTGAIACAAGTQVQTAQGPVCGTVDNGVTEWLGIPYAAPPVGALRWQPPQPAAPWTAPLQATAFGDECIQPSPDQGGLPVAGSSENCLFVNVWAPPGSSSDSSLPVMVHIHGGGFFAGSGNGDNTLLATTGHEVIVSLNYRLGIFGFLADSAMGPHAGDYGLQDQQAALRWVQQNISAFGGDPHDVTIFGESAGGSSVCDQIASPTAKGLFQKAISTSGEYNTVLGTITPPRTPFEDLESQDCKSALPTEAAADRIGAQFAAGVGCGSGTANVAACLQSVSTDAVTLAADSPRDGFQFGGLGTIAPTINGSTLTMTLRQALRTGQVNRVPVIAGTDRDEDLVGDPTTASAYVQLVHQEYGGYAPQVLARYPLSHFDSPLVAFRTVAADSDTVCPSLITDRDLSRWMPVYGYELDDDDIPPYAATGTANTPAGASHVGAWFLNPVSPALDANQQALQDEEVASVTHFARTGNPSAPGTPEWPQFRPSQSEMVLAPAGDSAVMSIYQIMAIHNCGFWDRLAPNQ